MSTASNLAVINGGSALPTLNTSNEQKIQAIRDTVAKGATDAEFTMLMHLANTYKLDPFLKEIWFIKYNGKDPTILVSRDGLRNYAMRQEDFLGMLSFEVRQGDTFKFNPISGEIQHEIGDGTGLITKCYCIIKRKDKPDHIEIIDFKEYYDALSQKNPVWRSHPSAMGKKTVEVLGLKKCYTITGLYAPEEMGMQEPMDITDQVEVVDQQPPTMMHTQQHQQPPRQQNHPTANADGPSEAQIKYMHRLKNDKGISENDFRQMMAEMCGGKLSAKDLSKKEASEFINFLNAYQPQPGFVPEGEGNGNKIEIDDDNIGF
ncbi:hypothetical protein CIG75_19225 [Tumebacillus algifaecis]|uniref:Phage recombination protein Bet n=1 Tax=Tumebacillus algifaecis TaxID=1214604 RepID=A0A223D627_9BACL|nr:RecT family recombinase [Tumebacillus algifaecis]ASS76866.1 hypothetical protein CIG75_19225 [Tumebacillus algifaecis]